MTKVYLKVVPGFCLRTVPTHGSEESVLDFQSCVALIGGKVSWYP